VIESEGTHLKSCAKFCRRAIGLRATGHRFEARLLGIQGITRRRQVPAYSRLSKSIDIRRHFTIGSSQLWGLHDAGTPRKMPTGKKDLTELCREAGIALDDKSSPTSETDHFEE